MLYFRTNIHHCQQAYTVHMPLTRPISQPVAIPLFDWTAHSLIYCTACQFCAIY